MTEDKNKVKTQMTAFEQYMTLVTSHFSFFLAHMKSLIYSITILLNVLVNVVGFKKEKFTFKW